MATSAIASFQKVDKKCPKCGERGAKEIVSQPGREVHLGWFLFLLLPGGLGLLLVPLWWRKVSRLAAVCPACHKVFRVKSI